MMKTAMTTARAAVFVAVFSVLASCDVLQNQYVDTLYEVKVKVEEAGSGGSFGSELFPFEPGARWVYFSTSESVQWEVTDRFAAINMIQANVVQESTTEYSLDRYFLVSKSGVFDHGSQFAARLVPVARLHFPVKNGKKWSVESKGGDFMANATVEGTETVATPMGLFQALRIVYAISDHDRGNLAVERMWFAAGVGVVKMEVNETTYLLRYYDIGSEESTSEE